MDKTRDLTDAPEITTGIEDKFYYTISDQCVRCGKCAKNCPVGAIHLNGSKYEIDPNLCIDCGTCAAVCPTGAAAPAPLKRNSIELSDIDWDKCCFNAGCALNLYKPKVAKTMFSILKQHYPNITLHSICCRHNPNLRAGTTIINNCAGCDRRFRSLYEGIRTISFWEIADSIPDLTLPDYSGHTVSVHDSCGYRHKPQVHRAVRSLLKKMKIEIVEAELHGTESVCCGDNFYGHAPNEEVEERIRLRAGQFPCENVVVYCIGCVRAMEFGRKKPYYLPDLICGTATESMPDTLDEYHRKLSDYIREHN